MTRVLVTGGSGFVGSNVAAVLRQAGYSVVVCDLRRPSCDVEFVQADLLDLAGLVEATRGMDAVCHLAAIGDVYLAFDQPSLAASVNVTGTANLMEACLQSQVARVVYASTWEVYGAPQYQPVDESHPCRPDHPYNITKLAGEQLALAYDRLKGVPAVALRLGTAYGIGMRPNSVFSIFIRKAMRGEPLTIKGSGEQFRQFTHARDIGYAFARALTSTVRGQPFNVVAEEPVSIGHLAELVARELPVDIVYEQARAGDVPPSRVSSKKARDVLGWKAEVSFETGLQELIEWYRGHVS